MMWIGLLVGAAIGALLAGLPGAIVCGFAGWLVGIVIQSNRRSKDGPPKVAMPRETLEARVARLEKTVAELQARLEIGPSAASGVVPDAAPAAMVPAPILSPDPVVPGAAPAAKGRDPITSSKPNPFVGWLTGGNTIARAGLLILFLGLAFLAKYAADNSMLPVELRVAAVAIGGIALLVFGWRLRAQQRAYALGLQGGGIAVLYLTTFAALRLWSLLPPEMAFAMLAAVAVFAAILAVAQDAMALAVIGAAGGFMAPVLASTGQGSHVMLFSYFLLLNLGIAGVALFKAWRPLNLTGFFFTFFIATAWGVRSYRDEHFATTEPFLIVFFVLFLVVAILFARNQPPELKKFVDGTLVFGVPLAAFGLQAGMLRHTELGLAWTALAAAAIYLSLATCLRHTGRENWRLLSEAFFALGVVFVTVAIPLALDARWTSASWALEGAAIVWIGLRQEQRIARLFGIALQVLAGAAFIHAYPRLPAEIPLVDAAFVGAVLMSMAGLWTHRKLLGARAEVTRLESRLVPVLFAWGLLWWLFAGHHEIDEFVRRPFRPAAGVAFLTATAAALGMLSLRWSWPHAATAARLFLPALWLSAVWALLDRPHPLGNLGWAAWPAAIALQMWILRALEPETVGRAWRLAHAGTVWLVALLAARELNWGAAQLTAHATAWSAAAIAVAPALLLIALAHRGADARWPVVAQPVAYRGTAALGLAVALAAWSVFVNLEHAGSSSPLPYVPLLNAIDLGHILGAIAVGSTVLALRRTPGVTSPLRSKAAAVVAGLIAFAWLNAVLLRTLHHWAQIPYNADAMSRSVLAQASLSIFWSVLALGLMVFAARRALRSLWIVGAALMGVVVVKLFVVDLSNVGGIERIVSFIAVGVLMLVIGYFSPVPPRKQEVTT